MPSSPANFILKLFFKHIFHPVGHIKPNSCKEKKKPMHCYFSTGNSKVFLTSNFLWVSSTYRAFEKFWIIQNLVTPKTTQAFLPALLSILCFQVFQTILPISQSHPDIGKNGHVFGLHRISFAKTFQTTTFCQHFCGISLWESQGDKIRLKIIFLRFHKWRISQQEGQEETTQVSFLVKCHFPVRKP